MENYRLNNNIFSRKFKFTCLMAKRNVVPANLPYKAILLVTWKCQARCRMCNIWQREKQDELSLDEWRLFFQRNSYLQWLTLSGGEPFLRADVDEIVCSAMDFCPALYCINMPTNALSPELVEKKVGQILTLGVPKFVLSISLDGPPDIHDKVRGVPGAWRRAMELLQWAKSAEKENRKGFSVVIEHTLQPDSYGRFAEMVELVKQEVPGITATDFMVTMASVSKHYYGNADKDGLAGSLKDPQALEAALRHVIAVRDKVASLSLLNLFSRFFLKMAVQYARSGVPAMKCCAGRSSVFIDPAGVVYPCNSYTRPLGSLREHDYSIEKVFSRNDMAKIYDDIDKFKCGGCWTPCEASLSFAENIINPLWAWRIIKSGWFCN